MAIAAPNAESATNRRTRNRNQPIDAGDNAVDNKELNLALLGFEIQTELLPESGKDRIGGAVGC